MHSFISDPMDWGQCYCHCFFYWFDPLDFDSNSFSAVTWSSNDSIVVHYCKAAILWGHSYQMWDGSSDLMDAVIRIKVVVVSTDVQTCTYTELNWNCAFYWSSEESIQCQRAVVLRRRSDLWWRPAVPKMNVPSVFFKFQPGTSGRGNHMLPQATTRI